MLAPIAHIFLIIHAPLLFLSCGPNAPNAPKRTQAAQERESLQREGDQLNEAIKVAEKEIRLLQRTLQSLVIRNDNFRASFHKVRVCDITYQCLPCLVTWCLKTIFFFD